MENETSKSTFLGVTLVMLVAVVVIGLAIFAVARGIMNNAQTSFVKTMDGASNASLSDFDGTTVSGVKVRGALEDYEGQNYFILVNTAAVQKKSCGAAKAVAKASDGTYPELASVKYTKPADATAEKDPHQLATREYYTQLQQVPYEGRLYLVYNAQIGEKDEGGSKKLDGIFTANTAGHIDFEGTFKTEDGMVKFNSLKTNWKTSGCSEFISNSSSYVCKLIKDPSGTIVGIMFTEVY